MIGTAIFDNILDNLCIFVKILAAYYPFLTYSGYLDTFAPL